MLSDSRVFLLLRKVTARRNAMQHFILIKHIYVFPMGEPGVTPCSLTGSITKKEPSPGDDGSFLYHI